MRQVIVFRGLPGEPQLAWFFVCLLLTLPAQAQLTAIQNARVIDGTGGAARSATVILNGSQIQSVGPDLPIPPNARIIDARGQTLLPGIIDLHTHLTASAATGLSGDLGKILKAYLARGVTSVVEMSSYGEMFAPIRALNSSGAMPGPHIVFAARMSTPGGHGAESGMGETITTEVSSPEAVHEAMRRILAYKPDAIKAFTDGWRYGSTPSLSSMNDETVAAIVNDAHAAGIKVVSHTVTLGGAKIAARNGIDVIDHGIGDLPADAEVIRLLKEHGNHYGFTLAVYEPKQFPDPPPSLTSVLEPAILQMLLSAPRGEPIAEARKRRFSVFEQNAAALHKAGIPIGSGTDAGMPQTFHGYATLHEMELLANDCGFTPLEALKAGTSVGAEGLGLSDRGVIAPGKLADLVLVEGEPDRNIKDIENTRLVFLAGKEYNPRELEAAIRTTELTPLPVHQIPALIDDMERPEKRTALDTLRIETVDAGADHSRVVTTQVVREGANHSLLAAVHFGPSPHPYVRLEIPVTRGAIELGDVSRYTGISFDMRGQAAYRLLLKTYGIRDNDWYAASVAPATAWRTVRIPFTDLKRKNAAVAWPRRDLRSIVFEISGRTNSTAALELDNLSFY